MWDILAKLFDQLISEADFEPKEDFDPDFEKNEASFWSAIKLIHSGELGNLAMFPKYQDHRGIFYSEYKKQRKTLEKLKIKHSEPLRWREELTDLNRDELEEYEAYDVEIRPSIFPLKSKVVLKPQLQDTLIHIDQGKIFGDVLVCKRRWRKYTVRVTYKSSKKNVYASKIESLNSSISGLDEFTKKALHKIDNSIFNHPVIFVSHRWESHTHPDPNSSQLEKLRNIKDCFLLYDYSSFPQEPLSNLERRYLKLILKYMTRLINNVVVIESFGYVDRGWCIYEYIAASMRGTIVCDEIQDERFVSLRNWVATKVPVPEKILHDSWESRQQNFVNEKILDCVNAILPVFKESSFTVYDDRDLVRSLLKNMLRLLLPPKKEHQPYIGEWKNVDWTDEELDKAFDSELKWEKQQIMDKLPFDMDVPKKVSDAVENRYQVKRDTVLKKSLF